MARAEDGGGLGTHDTGTAADGSGSPGDASSPPIHVTGLVQWCNGYVPCQVAVPFEGAEMCLYAIETSLGVMDLPKSPCVTTGPDGMFDLYPVPANTNVAISGHKTGFIPGARPVHTEQTDVHLEAGTIWMAPVSAVANLDYPGRDAAGKGDLDFFARGPGSSGLASGVRVSIVAHPELHPVYEASPTNNGNPAYTETIDGLGFIRMDPGIYRIAFESDTGKCLGLSGQYGWPSERVNEVRAPMFAAMDVFDIGGVCEGSPPSYTLNDAGTATDSGLVADGGAGDAAKD